VTHLQGLPVAPEGITVRNPAFDVTPARYNSGIITEKGVIAGDYTAKLKTLVKP
jgi:methylthioribose-1-phosphate isomerase